VEGDDLLAPDKITRQIEAFNQGLSNRTLLSSEWAWFLYRYYRAEFTPTKLWCDLPPAEWLLRKMGQNLHMQTATWLVSRELTDAAGPWDSKLLSDDDGDYFCRVLLASDRIRFVPEAKMYYRAPGIAFGGTLSYIGRSRTKLEAHWRSMRLHIFYLRCLEDSERVRAACLHYLQTCFIYYYPEMSGIVEEAQKLASEMGGRLEPPHLVWKYFWIQRAFGWALTKRLQVFLPRTKWWFKKSWDKALFRIESRGLAADWGMRE
jgi:hypothetical protein